MTLLELIGRQGGTAGSEDRELPPHRAGAFVRPPARRREE